MINAPNVQWPSGTGYLVGDRGTEALGVKDVSPAVPEIIVATYNFEVVPPGVGTWLLDPLNPHSGLFCFRSAPILANQSTQWDFTIPAPATALRFWWRVSSEAGFDFFEIYKDSVTVPNRIFQQSGPSNVWAQAMVNFAGATNLIFRYSKDGSASVGLDAAFVDDFEWLVPGSPAVQNYEPPHLNTNNEVKVCDFDTQTALSTINTNLLAFKVENDSNLDAVNAELDVQTALLTTIEADLDAVNASLDVIEAIETGANVKFASFQSLLAGDLIIVPLVLGKRIRVLSYAMTTDSTGNQRWKSGLITNISGLLRLDRNGNGIVYAGTPSAPAFQTAVGESLVLSATANTGGHVTYLEV